MNIQQMLIDDRSLLQHCSMGLKELLSSVTVVGESGHSQNKRSSQSPRGESAATGQGH